MPLPDDLGDEAEIVDYLTTLRGSYDQRIQIEILTHERDLISTFNAVVTDGQVDCQRVELDPTWDGDGDQHVESSRSLRGLGLYDPSHVIAVDENSPADLALSQQRSLRVWVLVRGRLRWYRVPVFTGPISDVERDGPIITVEAAAGCEAFGMGAAMENRPVKGLKVDAIRELMYRTGEVAAWMDIPSSTEKLASSIAITNQTRYWDKAFSVAASMDRLCLYDGYGRFRTPEADTTPVIDFTTGNDGLLLADPRISSSLDGFANTWLEQTNKKGGKNIFAEAHLPDAHRLSALKLGRNGKKLHKLGFESNGDLRTKKKAGKRARTMLAQAEAAIPVEGECRPVWHLSPFEWASTTQPTWSTTYPLSEFSLPLAGGNMRLGYRELIRNR